MKETSLLPTVCRSPVSLTVEVSKLSIEAIVEERPARAPSTGRTLKSGRASRSAFWSRLVFLGALVVSGVCCGSTKGEGSVPVVPGAPALTDAEREALSLLELRDSAIPADPTNRYAEDPAAAAFGQKLFFYPGFSGPLLNNDNDGSPETLGRRGETGRVACSGCHRAEAGFVDDRSRGKQISLASGWVLRKTPSLLDVGQRRLFTWVGKSDSFYNQVFFVIENDLEMNSSRLFVAQEVFRTFREEYERVFGAMPSLDDASRFPPLEASEAGCDSPRPMQPPVCRGRPGDSGPYDGMAPESQDAVTRVVVNVGKAMGAYMRLLTCGPSRFDAWLAGDQEALTDSEQRGAALFVGRARCVQCHTGPFLTDFKFHNVGLKPGVVAISFIDKDDRGAIDGLKEILDNPLNSRGPYSDGDDGRLPDSVDDSYLGAFQTPSLRCVSQRPSFMHTGQFTTLEEVVGFFDSGGSFEGFLGKSEIQPLSLESSEREDLVAFLKALAGPGPAPELLGP